MTSPSSPMMANSTPGGRTAWLISISSVDMAMTSNGGFSVLALSASLAIAVFLARTAHTSPVDLEWTHSST